VDIFVQTLGVLCASPTVRAWPEMQALLERAAAHRPRSWTLPVLACEAVGGMAEQAVPASAALACLHTSIMLIDDLLDADPRGEHHRLGAPAVANLAAAFQAVSMNTLAQSRAEPAATLLALRSLTLAALTTSLGQHLDTQNPADEAGYWRVVEAKSAPFFGAALQVGALLGGASLETAEQLRGFGQLYGEMIQIHDDLNDALAVPASPEWTLGRPSLPILFAQVVDHPERDRFLALRRAIPDSDALAEAQSILIRCGAISYGAHALLSRYRTAREVLGLMPLVNRSGLEALLESQVRPVRELFRALGGEPIDGETESEGASAGQGMRNGL
jgi:geranylgeranyl pyrophosphate synthase